LADLFALRLAAFLFGAFFARRGALRLAFDLRLVAISKNNFYLFFYGNTKQNYTN
jgi:hypothetical protein